MWTLNWDLSSQKDRSWQTMAHSACFYPSTACLENKVLMEHSHARSLHTKTALALQQQS